MEPEPILYTWSGDAALAYQVTGEGERDLFNLGTWGSTLELSWSFPPHARFLAGLAAFARLVLHDDGAELILDGEVVAAAAVTAAPTARRTVAP